MKRITPALTALVVVVAAQTTAGVAAADSPGLLSAQEIQWQPCAQDPAADCGTLRLPLDYAKPRGEQFDLALARRKATDQANRIGVLLASPGGPGASGVDMVLGDTRMRPEILARFDLVAWDRRGVGRTSPVRCSADLLATQPLEPADQAGFDALAAHNRRLWDDCRARSGSIVDHADTLSAVRDMEQIRRALGEEKISYFGFSYATVMGHQYAEHYGHRLRAMVLDGNMDHSQGIRPFVTAEAVAAENAFTEWVKWCDRTPSCSLHGRDVLAFWTDLLAKADRGEVVDPADPHRRLTGPQIISTAFNAFYGPDWPGLTTYLTGLRTGQAKRNDPPAPTGKTVESVFQATFCADWSMPLRDFAEYRKLRDRELALAPHMRGTPLTRLAIAMCVGLADKVTNPQRRLNIRTAPKFLLLNSVYDPASAYPWAVNVHRQTRDTTVLITYEGWGHRVYRARGACVDDKVHAYLFDLKLPGESSVRCAAVEPV